MYKYSCSHTLGKRTVECGSFGRNSILYSLNMVFSSSWFWGPDRLYCGRLSQKMGGIAGGSCWVSHLPSESEPKMTRSSRFHERWLVVTGTWSWCFHSVGYNHIYSSSQLTYSYFSEGSTGEQPPSGRVAGQSGAASDATWPDFFVELLGSNMVLIWAFPINEGFWVECSRFL